MREHLTGVVANWHARTEERRPSPASFRSSWAVQARVIRHLARITWEHGLVSSDLSDRCERLLRDLPEHLVEQGAVVGAILADRLAYVPGAQRRRHQLAADAVEQVEAIADPAVEADVLLLPVRRSTTTSRRASSTSTRSASSASGVTSATFV